MKQKKTFPFLLMVLLTCVGARAATLSDYKQRLELAHSTVDELSNSISGNKDLAESVLTQKTAEIRAMLPAAEHVEYQGGEVDVDNHWLGTALDELTSEQGPQKRRSMLTGISERLQGISKAVEDLQRAVEGTRTKDEDKQKLADILSRIDYGKAEQPSESLFDKIIRKIVEWLRGVVPQPSNAPALGDMSSMRSFVQVLVYVAIVGLLAFGLYKLAPYIGFGKQRKKKEKKRSRVILGEHISEDESSRDLLDEAERLATSGQVREAIRKGYIAALCELADRRIIGLARHKTNRDYLRDLRKRQDIFEEVNGLTGTYERNWYGLRPAADPDWQEFRGRYNEIMSRLAGR